MDDNRIVDLYWERSETAIAETQKKYGSYCHHIAYHILYSQEDAKECVNDTYIKAWQSMPPHKPGKLAAFLGTITRNLALDRYAYQKAQKRSGQASLVLDELGECIPDPATQGDVVDEIALKDAINAFLRSLPPSIRIVFLQRYWYLCSVKEIAQNLDLTESNVKVILHRTRLKFKSFLEKEGISI